MASVKTSYAPFKTGAALTFPVVIKSPYIDWESLLVRVKVKTASELFIGAVFELADSGTPKIVEITADKSLHVYGIIVRNNANLTQLEADNTAGVKLTKELFFAANSYVWVLPLIPGFVISARLKASVSSAEVGQYVCSTADSDFRALDAIVTDVDPSAKLGRIIGADNTNGTGLQYVAVAIV